MTSVEIISLIVTFIGVASFAAVFTILYLSFSNSSILEVKTGKRDIELIDDVLYNRQEKVIKRKKTSSAVKNTLFYVVMTLIIPIFVFSLINKFQGNTTMIGNSTVMVVASGSMSEKNEANDYLVTNNLNNQFNTYDIIVLNKVESMYQLRKYDVIAFKNDDGINVIHRIVDISYENGKLVYITRGDSNNSNDKYHPCFDDVIGKYSNKKIGGIGIFIVFFQSAPGIMTVVAMVYVLVMMDRINNKMEKAQEERIAHLAEIITHVGDDNESTKQMTAIYNETIYYKGYAYHFNDHGFVSKDEILDADVLEKSESTIIKVSEDENRQLEKKEVIVDEIKENDLNNEKEDVSKIESKEE